jgi:DNA-binding transcriptional ArsR family regulator
MDDRTQELVAEAVFAALADANRRAILAELSAHGPATVTELAAALPLTRQGISKHLVLLVDAGLVAPQPGERRRVRYHLRSEPMRVPQQMLAALARDWDAPLAALKDRVESAPSTPPRTPRPPRKDKG